MTYTSNINPMFRSKFSEDIFNQKYRHENAETWEELAKTLVNDVDYYQQLTQSEHDQLTKYITDLKFIPGGRYLYYCSVAETKILKNDYTWSRADQIKTGDELVGFDEIIARSRFKPTIVTDVNIITRPTYKVNTTLGSVTVSEDHMFVGKSSIRKAKHPQENYRWLTTKTLLPGNVIMFSSPPWEVDTTFDGGWISGIMDGEGTVSKGSISIAQKPGKVLDNIERILTEKGILFYTSGRDTDVVKTVHIRGRWESIKALGMFRPLRLLENWNKNTLGSFWSRVQEPAVVESIEYLGEQEVFAIETTEKTLITNGFLSHNCGRKKKFFNNCFLLRAEHDTREDWADLSWKSESALMTGGGIGVDYSVYRGKGHKLSQTGGLSSGPIPKMHMINEIGRNVMQGGSRRSAIYASLNWKHSDINDFLNSKNWKTMPVGEFTNSKLASDGITLIPDTRQLSLWDIKQTDFNFPAPLDMTNISVNYDTEWLTKYWETGDVGDVFRKNVRQALETSEPGFSFNFFDKENETLRNACTEVTSEDDSDVCNLGSINLGRIDSLQEFIDIITVATKFLMLGTLRADLPYQKVYDVREKNRRLGLGLMGIHEWLIKKGEKYGVTEELHRWLRVYKSQSDSVSRKYADELGISRPVANRAIAPTGSIGILAGTTTGIEPVFSVAYKRRYLTNGTKWKYQYVVDSAAQELISYYGADPDTIESALDLANNYERRIKFQADIQDYVDMSISSTINLPAWGSVLNNEDTVDKFTDTLAKYAHRLRGFTAYADGSRGGQPLTPVPYKEAVEKLGEVFEESIETHDICVIGKGAESGC